MFNTMELLPSEAPIKFIYLGDTNRPTTEMGERRGCDYQSLFSISPAWSHRPADHRNVPTALGESAEALTASCNGGGGWGILWKSFFQLVKCNSVSFLQSGHIYDQRKDESSIIYIGKIISIKILISKIHENLSRERTQYSHRFFQNQFIFFVRHTQVTFGLNINQLYCEVMAMAHFCGLA